MPETMDGVKPFGIAKLGFPFPSHFHKDSFLPGKGIRPQTLNIVGKC